MELTSMSLMRKMAMVNYNDNASPYLLKFLQPHSYFLEDGNDKLTTEKMEAIYPYTNGDGNLNIYGAKMNKEQMEGGANTRPRWVWFFESKNSDPYHVKIHSRSTISYNGISHPPTCRPVLYTSIRMLNLQPNISLLVVPCQL